MQLTLCTAQPNPRYSQCSVCLSYKLTNSIVSLQMSGAVRKVRGFVGAEFSKRRIRAALAEADDDVEEAVSILLDGSSPGDSAAVHSHTQPFTNATMYVSFLTRVDCGACNVCYSVGPYASALWRESVLTRICSHRMIVTSPRPGVSTPPPTQKMLCTQAPPPPPPPPP